MESSFDLIRDGDGQVVGKEPKNHGVAQKLGKTPLFAEPREVVVEVAEKVENDPVHGTYYRFVEQTQVRMPTVLDLPENPYVTGSLDYLEMRATARVWGTRVTDSGAECTWFDVDLRKPQVEILGTTGAPAAERYHHEVVRHITAARNEQLQRFGVNLSTWIDFLNQRRTRGRPGERTLLDWARLAMIAASSEGSARQRLREAETVSDETAKDFLKRMRGLTGNPIRGGDGEILVLLEMTGPANRPKYRPTALATTLVQFAAPF